MDELTKNLSDIPSTVWTGLSAVLASIFTFFATRRADKRKEESEKKKEKNDDFLAIMTESKELRDWVKAELADTRANLNNAEKRILELTKEISSNLLLIHELNKKLAGYEQEIVVLRQKIVDQEIVIAQYSKYKEESEKRIVELTEIVIKFSHGSDSPVAE